MAEGPLSGALPLEGEEGRKEGAEGKAGEGDSGALADQHAVKSATDSAVGEKRKAGDGTEDGAQPTNKKSSHNERGRGGGRGRWRQKGAAPEARTDLI